MLWRPFQKLSLLGWVGRLGFGQPKKRHVLKWPNVLLQYFPLCVNVEKRLRLLSYKKILDIFYTQKLFMKKDLNFKSTFVEEFQCQKLLLVVEKEYFQVIFFKILLACDYLNWILLISVKIAQVLSSMSLVQNVKLSVLYIYYIYLLPDMYYSLICFVLLISNLQMLLTVEIILLLVKLDH